jgi:hypothetical protein
MMPNDIAILSSLLVGLAATLGTIVIHGFVVHTIVMTLRSNLQRGVLGVRIWVNMTFIVGATLLPCATGTQSDSNGFCQKVSGSP